VEVDSLRIEVDSLRIEVDSRRVEVDSRRVEVDSRRIEVDSRRVEVDSRRIEIESLRIEIDSLRIEIDSLRIEIDSLRIEVDSRRVEVDSLRIEIDSRRIEIDSLRIEVDSLRIEVDSRRVEVDSRRIEIDSRRVEIDSLRVEVDSRNSGCSVQSRTTGLRNRTGSSPGRTTGPVNRLTGNEGVPPAGLIRRLNGGIFLPIIGTMTQGYPIVVFAALFSVAAASCSKPAPPPLPEGAVLIDLPADAVQGEDGANLSQYLSERDQEAVFDRFLGSLLDDAGIPPDMARRIKAAAAEGPSFILDLLVCLSGDPFLWILVDKAHPLPDGYAPAGLVTLSGGSYEVNRPGHRLRQAAADSLEEMAAAARTGGVTLIVSSAYRSYEYQAEVYNRNVRELGREAADRESAWPGCSQHQLGLVVDFGAEDGSIGDHFAQTPAGRWMAANAGAFGWSLSFPAGREAVTGYRGESWHYRYAGRDLAAFIDTYFDGVQQYALQFIHEWVKRSGEMSG
jgi:D-alanyl-D-alanine carboxypeptidase